MLLRAYLGVCDLFESPISTDCKQTPLFLQDSELITANVIVD